jgi:hypothetical protein
LIAPLPATCPAVANKSDALCGPGERFPLPCRPQLPEQGAPAHLEHASHVVGVDLAPVEQLARPSDLGRTHLAPPAADPALRPRRRQTGSGAPRVPRRGASSVIHSLPHRPHARMGTRAGGSAFPSAMSAGPRYNSEKLDALARCPCLAEPRAFFALVAPACTARRQRLYWRRELHQGRTACQVTPALPAK